MNSETAVRPAAQPRPGRPKLSRPGPGQPVPPSAPVLTAPEDGAEWLALHGAETGLSVLAERWQRAVEELGCVTPPAQLRALLLIDAAGRLNVTALARELGASPSATSKLGSRLETAGLVTREAAAASRREVLLAITESGQRLAGWVRAQRRAAMTRALAELSPEGRADLTRGLADLAEHLPR